MAEGYTVTDAGSVDALFAAVGRGKCDLIALGLALGADDGLDLARRVRAVRNVPIIMMTDASEPYDRLAALESGADDCVARPFLVRELAMRIRLVLRRYQLEARLGAADRQDQELQPHLLEFDHAVLDVKAKAVTKIDGTPIDLTDTEYRILELLIRNPERVLSRDEIWQELKGREWTPLDRTIDGHVARLRRKIEPAGEAPVLIRSVRGVGYVFAGKTKSGAMRG